MSRFDYVAYDYTAVVLQAAFKTLCQQVEHCVIHCVNTDELIEKLGKDIQNLAHTGRTADLALCKLMDLKSELKEFPAYNDDDAIDLLEELYMWVGKAIRDDQIKRNGSAPLQEGRKDG